MAESYIAKVRGHLAAHKRAGTIPFDAAWRSAMEAHPPPGPWGDDGTGRRCGRGDEGPLSFARRMMELAYYDYEMPGPDMRALCAIFEEDADDTVGLCPTNTTQREAA